MTPTTLKTLGLTFLVAATTAGCVLPPPAPPETRQDRRYNRPLPPPPEVPAPLPRDSDSPLATKFRVRANYLDSDRVNITLTPYLSQIRETLTRYDDVWGKYETTHRSAANTERDRNPANDGRAYYYSEIRGDKEYGYRLADKNEMSTDQLRQRARLAGVYNTIAGHLPSNASGIDSVKCTKNYGEAELTCTTKYRMRYGY